MVERSGQGKIKPKPCRAITDWAFYAKLPHLEAKFHTQQEAEAKGLITCRDCFGFGHSVTKCPTTRILDANKQHSELYRTLLTRYRLATRSGYEEYKAVARDKWPFRELWDKDYAHAKS